MHRITTEFGATVFERAQTRPPRRGSRGVSSGGPRPQGVGIDVGSTVGAPVRAAPVMKVVAPHLGTFFDTLYARGVQFVVLRNYASLPACTENDLDIEVRAADRERFEEALDGYARENGFKLFRRVDRPHVCMYKLFRQSGDTLDRLLLDVQYAGFSWYGLPYLDDAEIVAEARDFKGFRVPSRLHEWLSKLLLNMLTASSVPEKYLPELAQEARTMHADVEAFFAARFEGLDAASFVRDVEAGDMARLRPWIGRLKRSLVVTALRRAPVRSAAAVVNAVWAEVRFYLNRPGVFVVLVGPDGVGKTSVARRVMHDMRSVFKAGRYFHWIPDVLGPWSDPVPTSGERGVDPPEEGSGIVRSVASRARIVRSAVRALLGYAFRIYPELVRDRIVIGDRFLYGYLGDPRALRYHGPSSVVRDVLRFVPHPDLVFVLHADAAEVHARKSELSQAEVNEVYERLKDLDRYSGRSRVEWIDASRDVEAVAGQVTHRILAFLYERDVRGRDGREGRHASPH